MKPKISEEILREISKLLCINPNVSNKLHSGVMKGLQMGPRKCCWQSVGNHESPGPILKAGNVWEPFQNQHPPPNKGKNFL